MMIGLDVAPVAPQARLRATSSGSTESSQTLVPAEIRDCNGVVMMVLLDWVQHFLHLFYSARPNPGNDLVVLSRNDHDRRRISPGLRAMPPSQAGMDPRRPCAPGLALPAP